MRAIRLADHPQIHPGLLPGAEGSNINGPCLVKVPDWVATPLARYYCYFAHHSGTTIRLAYAEDLRGPWQIYPGGVFAIEDLPNGVGHIASPDVIWDAETRTCRLYLHAPLRDGKQQVTFLVCGNDGLHFPEIGHDALAPFYLRVWRADGWWYGMAKGGRLFRSRDGRTAFERGPHPLADMGESADDMANNNGARHVAIDPQTDAVMVYGSSIGDTPERIWRRRLPTTGDWTTWQAGSREEVLHSERNWEGANLPVVTSHPGAVHHPEHALRDPHVLVDQGRRWLAYSVAGEQGIAFAEIIDDDTCATE